VSTPSISVITGTESFLSERAVSDIRAGLRKLREFDTVEITVDEETRSGDLTISASANLLGGNRLVIINNVELLSEELIPELRQIIEFNDPELFLVIKHQDGRRNKKLLTELTALGNTIQANKVTGKKEILQFVQLEAARHKRKITADAIEALRVALGDDIRMLAAAIDQITASSSESISRELVDVYVEGIADIRGYHVSDRIWAGDLANALEKFRWMVLNNGHGANIQVISAIAQDLRTMIKVMGAEPGMSDRDIATSIGLNANMDWKVKNLRQIARGWKPAALAYFANRLADIDAQIKGGAEGIGLDESARTAVVEKLMLEIAAPGAR
jgi:DNA polymerase-3 subunit delta